MIQLEEEWGDWLMSQKAMDAAINHYIESGSSVKVMACKAYSFVDRQKTTVSHSLMTSFLLVPSATISSRDMVWVNFVHVF